LKGRSAAVRIDCKEQLKPISNLVSERALSQRACSKEVGRKGGEIGENESASDNQTKAKEIGILGVSLKNDGAPQANN